MRTIALGVHVVDVLVRPVERIPDGQGGQLVEEIRITPAGPAGGTAITLAKLGAEVQCAGAIGTDALGDVLLDLLGRFGVDTSLLVRRDGVQTSASVLPIRPDGSRPAFHVVGANATYASADAPWDAIAAATNLHLGAPEFMGGAEAAEILSFARERGVVTSADILAPGDQAGGGAGLDRAGVRAPRLPAAQRGAGARPQRRRPAAGRLPGAAGARRRLRGRHLRRRRRDRRRLGGAETVPAFAVDVVDTTGCGDAFSAGFLRGRALGRSRVDAARLGCAAAALVAAGLGSDHGDFDLDGRRSPCRASRRP